MTGWDDHHPDFDGGGDGDPAAALPEEPYGLLDPASLDDVLGDPAPEEPGPVDPGLPDEPAGLPVEVSVDWSADPDPAGEVSAPAGDWATDDPAGWTDDPPDDGTDPAGWATGGEPEAFPPALDLDLTPADGGPWTDPDLLGGPDAPEAPTAWSPPTDGPIALRPDLALAHGDPDASWSALRSSDDPAVRALALRWTA